MNAESVGVDRSGLFRQTISAEREQIFRGFRARGVVVEPRLAIISPRESKSNCFRARGAEREAPTKVGAIENPFLSAEKPHSKSYHHRRNRAFSAVALRKILS